MTNRYAVIIQAPVNVVAEVQALKHQLQQAIGSLSSANTPAHITFNMFSGGLLTLQRWEEYIVAFAQQLVQSALSFEEVIGFSNGALVILPNQETRTLLTNCIQSFYKHRPVPGYGKSKVPHISIVRQLNAEQMQVAKTLIAKVPLQFAFDNLSIRRFDVEAGKYMPHKTFPIVAS